WALKESQKFDIKKKEKHISKNVVPLLKAFFLVKDANKSDRYIAKDMLNELYSIVYEETLEDKEIPKLTTIANWISEYTKKHQQDLAKQSIEITKSPFTIPNPEPKI
ncbi:3839_t:CDS:2, partial [Cetraspora pellucida]